MEDPTHFAMIAEMVQEPKGEIYQNPKTSYFAKIVKFYSPKLGEPKLVDRLSEHRWNAVLGLANGYQVT